MKSLFLVLFISINLSVFANQIEKTYTEDCILNNQSIKIIQDEDFFLDCYANVIKLDKEGNYLETLTMETCVAERFSDCTSHVKDWIKGLEAQGFYLGASRYSWGAPIPK